MQEIAAAPLHCLIPVPDSDAQETAHSFHCLYQGAGNHVLTSHSCLLQFAARHVVCAQALFFPSLFNLLSCLGFLLPKWQEKLPAGWLEPLSSKGKRNTLLGACSLRLPLGELSAEVSVARKRQEACTPGGLNAYKSL